MKERIKKYYKKNQTKIYFYTWGFAAGLVASYLIYKIENNSVDVTAVKSPKNEGELRVRVLLSNGKTSSWYLPDK